MNDITIKVQSVSGKDRRHRHIRSVRGKRRKRLAPLRIDERRQAISSWLIRTLPNYDLFNMDSDSFNRLVWQNLNLLGLGNERTPEPTH